MEKSLWRSTQETGKKILSPLKYKTVRYGLEAILTASAILYALPIITEGQQKSFEVFVKCDDSKPTIEIISDIVATEGQTLWLAVTPVGRRDTRLLKNGKGRLSFLQRYTDSFQPDQQYTDYPRNSLSLDKGKSYVLGAYLGDVNILGNPRLTGTIQEVLLTVPSCLNKTNQN